MFQNWWWYRMNGQGREFQLNNQVLFQQSSPSAARLVYRQEDVIFDFDYTLTQLTGELAQVQIGFKIENLGTGPREVNFYSYTDFDVNQTAGNDHATFTAPNLMRVTDGNTPAWATLTASGTNLVGWEMASWPGLRNKLTNSVPDNLANGTSPFGPADWSGAFEWRANLAAQGGFGNQFVGSLVKTIYNPVPEPGTMLALTAGLGLLVSRRRNKK
jgi:hypothetical protein